MFTVEQAKEKLKSGGWEYRKAAPVLGVTYQWLAQVVNGQKKSAPLIEAIEALPTYQQWKENHEQTGE